MTYGELSDSRDSLDNIQYVKTKALTKNEIIYIEMFL